MEEIYAKLDTLIAEGRRKGITIIMGGDWNAVIGPRAEGDDAEVIGNFGIGQRNPRGQLLVEWVTAQRLAITTTRFQKNPKHQWTHSGGEDG